AELVKGSDFNFYGTTAILLHSGTDFRSSATRAITTLYSFASEDGANPHGLVQGSDGNFYGTTYGGGTNGGHGTFFKISATGALTTLYAFTGGKDGAGPSAGLVQ